MSIDPEETKPPLRQRLIQLGRSLRYLADPEVWAVEQDPAIWTVEEGPPNPDPAEVSNAMEKVRAIKGKVEQARQIIRSIPSSELIQKAKFELVAICESIRQTDQRAQRAITYKNPREAITVCRDALSKAFKKYGHDLEMLGHELVVAGEDAGINTIAAAGYGGTMNTPRTGTNVAQAYADIIEKMIPQVEVNPTKAEADAGAMLADALEAGVLSAPEFAPLRTINIHTAIPESTNLHGGPPRFTDGNPVAWRSRHLFHQITDWLASHRGAHKPAQHEQPNKSKVPMDQQLRAQETLDARWRLKVLADTLRDDSKRLPAAGKAVAAEQQLKRSDEMGKTSKLIVDFQSALTDYINCLGRILKARNKSYTATQDRIAGRQVSEDVGADVIRDRDMAYSQAPQLWQRVCDLANVLATAVENVRLPSLDATDLLMLQRDYSPAKLASPESYGALLFSRPQLITLQNKLTIQLKRLELVTQSEGSNGENSNAPALNAPKTANLTGAFTSTKTLAAAPPDKSRSEPQSQEEWLVPPKSLASLCAALGMERRALKNWLKKFGLTREGPSLWTIRVDLLPDEKTRQKVRNAQ